MANVDPVRPAVRAAFAAFNTPFEGRVSWMYCDVKGLVTTGMGNLIDPVAAALHLPWQQPSGAPATLNQIQDEWIAVKRRTDLCKRGGGAYKAITALRLSDAAINTLVDTKLSEMAAHVQAEHPCFVALPADAQMAVLSMAWAMGPAFRYPQFWTDVEANDFSAAAQQCAINPQIGTVVKRNTANVQCLLNAATVTMQAMDPTVLYYPMVVSGA